LLAFLRRPLPQALIAEGDEEEEEEGESALQPLNLGPDVFLRSAQALLQAAQEFSLLALGKSQVIVGQLSVFLLQLAFDFVPVAFEVPLFLFHDCKFILASSPLAGKE